MKIGDLVRHWNTRYEHIGVITDKRQIGGEVNFKVIGTAHQRDGAGTRQIDLRGRNESR